MKYILEKLFTHEILSREEAREVLTRMSEGAYNDSQVAAFITVFLMRDIHLEELRGFREALLELCHPTGLEDLPAIDVCGTGGDGKNTFNISTLSAFVLAGAGYPVLKHGNYGVSSVCGSSNVLEALGYRFKNDSAALQKEFEATGITLLHAPLFHPAMKAVAPVRKALGVKTFFNMLGPIVNPARPQYQLSGTFSLGLARRYHFLFEKEKKGYCVIHDLAGYDEISLTADAKMFTQQGEALLQPTEKLAPEALFGSDTVQGAAQIFTDILDGKGTDAQEAVVCTNAAAGIRCFHPERSHEEAKAEAQESLRSGRAKNTLQKLLSF